MSTGMPAEDIWFCGGIGIGFRTNCAKGFGAKGFGPKVLVLKYLVLSFYSFLDFV
ncbi:hypothetical protein RhiirA5_435047 [Rhizophagus irregularis]|uniref:Uncharacterized protein n=1 Tax=Rhizophagus irregularis TaxID=588596 RepID=A0A2N0NP02_9GLOM|nr:hypothetical protein RhiirA5_435047 [Rhizophagus irregularis]